MSIYLNRKEDREKRVIRIRKKISGTSVRPRLSVFRSNKYFYVQLIDDLEGRVLMAASTRDSGIKGQDEKIRPVEQAKRLGTQFALRCKERNIEMIVFDRRGYKYHGIIKAFADAMRESGIKF